MIHSAANQGQARSRRWKTRALLVGIGLVLAAVLPGAAGATITPVPGTSAGAAALAAVITSNPAYVTGASFAAVPPNGTPNGIEDSVLNSFPTDGSTFAILTTGDVNLADDAN